MLSPDIKKEDIERICPIINEPCVFRRYPGVPKALIAARGGQGTKDIINKILVTYKISNPRASEYDLD